MKNKIKLLSILLGRKVGCSDCKYYLEDKGASCIKKLFYEKYGFYGGENSYHIKATKFNFTICKDWK